MHVVCFDMQRHFLTVETKPACIDTHCHRCRRSISVCACCHAAGVSMCEACATGRSHIEGDETDKQLEQATKMA